MNKLTNGEIAIGAPGSPARILQEYKIKNRNNSGNRFFLYDGNILKAANHNLSQVLLYMQPSYKVFWGNPQNHIHDITLMCHTIGWLTFREGCEDIENDLS